MDDQLAQPQATDSRAVQREALAPWWQATTAWWSLSNPRCSRASESHNRGAYPDNRTLWVKGKLPWRNGMALWPPHRLSARRSSEAKCSRAVLQSQEQPRARRISSYKCNNINNSNFNSKCRWMRWWPRTKAKPQLCPKILSKCQFWAKNSSTSWMKSSYSLSSSSNNSSWCYSNSRTNNKMRIQVYQLAKKAISSLNQLSSKCLRVK